METSEREQPYDHSVEVKVRVEPAVLLWATLVSNTIALIPTAHDLLAWLTQR